MKSVILYETKKGSSKTCAERIQKNNNDAELYSVKDFTGNIDNYNNIVIVAPVYMGLFNKTAKKFIEKNLNLLLTKKVKIVLVGTNLETVTQSIENNFSDDMRNNFEMVHVGGAYNFDKLNFIQKFIIKKLAKVDQSTDLINYEMLDSITT